MEQPNLDERHWCVVGVDPGKQTGIAFFAWRPRSDIKDSLFGSVALPAMEVASWIGWVMDDTNVQHVFCEPYIFVQRTVKMTRQNDAIEVIGSVRNLCKERDVKFKLLQQNAAKKLGNITLLKQFGWHCSGDPDNHTNDAASQVALGLATYFPGTFQKLVSTDRLQ